jgi:predicted dinucleotide-binding enzyme
LSARVTLHCVALNSRQDSVYIANSRGPETLTDLAQKNGATPVTAREAARHGEIIVVTIPLKSIPDLPKNLFEGVPADVPVIDTSNYYPLLRDGQLPELESGDLTESEWVQQHLGRPVLKVFNNILAPHLAKPGQPAGTPGRVALPVAGDDAAAKQKVMALVEELGYDAVDAGSLPESWRQQPGSVTRADNKGEAEPPLPRQRQARAAPFNESFQCEAQPRPVIGTSYA